MEILVFDGLGNLEARSSAGWRNSDVVHSRESLY